MRLVYQEPSGGKRIFPLDKDSLTIGRLPSNDIVVEGTFVSRQHTRVHRRGATAVVQDLESRNGTFVNGQRVRERQLENGDEIAVGNNLFRYEQRLPEEVRFTADGPELLNSQGTIIKSIEDSSLLARKAGGLQEIVSDVKKEREVAAGKVEIDATELHRFRQERRNLMIVHEVAGQLTASVSLSELLERVMNLVTEVIPADRAYLLLLEEETNELVPMVVKTAGRQAGAYSGEEVEISRTIVNTVIKRRAAVRSSNAGADFEGSQSIMSFGISSVVAVPLWEGNKVIGVIYLDSSAPANVLGGDANETFPEFALDLLTTIGHQAALFIAQARLMEKFRKEQERRANFARFLSPAVAEHIISAGMTEGLQATEQEVTILFADITGFTSWSERLGSARAIAERLNEYFGLMTDVIFEHHGTLDKFIGDCVMALFGAPAVTGNDVANAVRCAAKMFEELERLMQDKPEAERFNIRIGINSGRCVAGMMGSVKRPEYTVLGDPVNTASRIESLAKPGCVYVGQSVYDAVKDQFKFVDAGTHQVKGKAEPVRVYRLER